MINSSKLISFMLTAAVIVIIAGPCISAQTSVKDMTIQLSGPIAIGTLRTSTYTATMNDLSDRDWTYKIYITAENTTGASPLIASPINGTVTPENNTFTFDITGQNEAGELEIHINCTSGVYTYQKVQKIYVVQPISLKAEIANPSNVVINNATVQFFVDGIEIDTQIIPSIGANQNTSVESEWIEYDKEPGWHDSRITVDLNSDGVIDAQAGDMIIDREFYIEGGSNWVFILTLFIGLFALIIGIGYISKKKMK